MIDLSRGVAGGFATTVLRDFGADVIKVAGLEDTQAKGWITVRTKGGWVVRFVGACGRDACAFIDVYLDSQGPTGILGPMIEGTKIRLLAED